MNNCRNLKFIHLLLFSVWLTVSCNGQDRSKTAGVPQHTITELQTLIEAGIDPYFVESTDTFSAEGPKCIVRDVIQDRKGNFWFATWQGIIGYDGKMFTNYTLKDHLIHFHVVSAFEDSHGNLWFGTARGGLYQYNGKTFTLFTMKEGLPDNSVMCLAEDTKGNIWFGTENGASCYNGKTFSNFTTEEGLSGNYINAIIQDQTGRIWLGGDGISWSVSSNEFSKGEKAFVTYTPQGLDIGRVTGLFEQKNGSIWIGTFKGLFRYDGKTFLQVSEVPGYLNYYMTEDIKGNMWFTSASPNPVYDLPQQSLYKYDGNIFTTHIEKFEPGDFQLFGKAADKAGNIWFGTMRGIGRYDGKSVHYL